MKLTSLIYLYYLLFVAIRIVAIAQTNVDGPNDFDELRVSNNQFRDSTNFNNVIPNNDESLNDKLEQQQRQQQQNQMMSAINLAQSPKTSRGQDSLKTVGSSRRLNIAPNPPPKSQLFSTNPTARQQNFKSSEYSPKVNRFSGLAGLQKQLVSDKCQPVRLRDFKNISIPLGELIVRDVEDRPCYTLSISGYIKWNEDAFFPLKNFRVYQHTIVEYPSGGASSAKSLNCSAASDCGSRNVTVSNQTYSFSEEIIVFVDCGYLVLKTYAHGHYISLESISFYRNADQSSNLLKKSDRELVKFVSQMKSENMIFSTAGTPNYPLFNAPLVFIYSCSNRIELTGKNSVQLVLLKFEIQRSAYLIHGFGSSRIPNGTMSEHDNIAQKSLLTVVTRCPNPRAPNFSLYSMMDNGFQQVDRTLAQPSVGTFQPVASRASNFWLVSSGLRFECYFRICLTLYIIQYCLKRGIGY